MRRTGLQGQGTRSHRRHPYLLPRRGVDQTVLPHGRRGPRTRHGPAAKGFRHQQHMDGIRHAQLPSRYAVYLHVCGAGHADPPFQGRSAGPARHLADQVSGTRPGDVRTEARRHPHARYPHPARHGQTARRRRRAGAHRRHLCGLPPRRPAPRRPQVQQDQLRAPLLHHGLHDHRQRRRLPQGDHVDRQQHPALSARHDHHNRRPGLLCARRAGQLPPDPARGHHDHDVSRHRARHTDEHGPAHPLLFVPVRPRQLPFPL